MSKTLWDSVQEPMNFLETIQSLEKQGAMWYVDVGPSGTLASFVKYAVGEHSKSRIFPILNPFQRGYKNLETLQESLDQELT